jgi:hypothetical protein
MIAVVKNCSGQLKDQPYLTEVFIFQLTPPEISIAHSSQLHIYL